jgi:hypothetical protein
MFGKTWLISLLPLSVLVCAQFLPAAEDDNPALDGRVDIRASGGLRIVGIKSLRPPGVTLPVPAEADPEATANSYVTMEELQVDSYPYPEPPLAGFSPLVALTTSNKYRPNDLEFTHILESSFQGLALNPPANANFLVAVFDSGSNVDMVAEPFNATVGLTGGYLTSNTVPITGTGGTADAIVTQPVGTFVGGLSVIDPGTGLLDLTKVVGHSNNSMLVAPEIACGNGEGLIAVIGTGLLSFYNTVIRVDTPVRRIIGGEPVLSPDVQMLAPSAPLPVFSRKIAMSFSGMGPATTACYYGFPDIFGGGDIDVIAPTMLALAAASVPTGGNFFSRVGAIEGEPSPLNPLQYMRMMVDTGAQSSILTPGMAANLNLDPAFPDFTVDVCGIGGLTTGVPGFYVDYIKINASGGAMQFAQVPFVVVDIPSPDGGEFDGVLGMNFFWNRNVIFDPSLSLSSFLHVSDPVPFAYGDFDRDLDVDQDDFAFFSLCSSGPGIPLSAECTLVDADGDDDVDQTDFGCFQVCISGENVIADVNCKP